MGAGVRWQARRRPWSGMRPYRVRRQVGQPICHAARSFTLTTSNTAYWKLHRRLQLSHTDAIGQRFRADRCAGGHVAGANIATGKSGKEWLQRGGIPARFAVAVDPPEDIIGFVLGGGRLFLMTENRLHVALWQPAHACHDSPVLARGIPQSASVGVHQRLFVWLHDEWADKEHCRWRRRRTRK